MSLFNESFYTDDFDEEMLEFLKCNYEVRPLTFNVTNEYLCYGTGIECFWTESLSDTYKESCRYLTKEQFKEKIGMNSKADNQVVPKELLRTGVIVEVSSPVQDTSSLAMVLLGTNNGDIISGETWGYLENNMDRIVKVYQPRRNIHYLNSEDGFKQGISLDGCHLIWERKSPEQLEIDRLEEEKKDIQNKINELKKGESNG